MANNWRNTFANHYLTFTQRLVLFFKLRCDISFLQKRFCSLLCSNSLFHSYNYINKGILTSYLKKKRTKSRTVYCFRLRDCCSRCLYVGKNRVRKKWPLSRSNVSWIHRAFKPFHALFRILAFVVSFFQ